MSDRNPALKTGRTVKKLKSFMGHSAIWATGRCRWDCILDTGIDDCHSFAMDFGNPLNTRAVDMSDLAHYPENWTDLAVVDRTGMTGLFKMHSQGWQPMNLPPPPPGASGTGAEFANLSTLSAVLSSFGL
jgi:uncharacterized protein (TIGR03435 family)